MKRIGVRTVTFTMASVVLYWAVPSAVRYPLKPGRTYAVRVEENKAVFDVPFEHPNQRYLLVVSNTSDDTSAAEVRLSSRHVDRPELIPLKGLRPLKPSIPNVRPYGAEETRTTFVSRRRRAKGIERTFYLPVTGGSADNPATYRPIDSVLRATGRYVDVYVDTDDDVQAHTLETIVALFDRSVRSTISQYLGWPRDVDGSGSFSILLTGWLGRLDGDTVSLGGMVRPADFRTDIATPFSNRADVLYLNSSVRPGRHLETLLVHELAHAAVCSARQEPRPDGKRPAEEAWLNEAIAHVAENLQNDNWSNLDYRIARYLASPADAPLVVKDYRAAGLHRDAGCRGSTYLFLRWCVDRYGVGLLPALIQSPASGRSNLEAVTGEPFDELFRRFTVDVVLNAARIKSASDGDESNVPLARADLSSPMGTWGLCGPSYVDWDLSRFAGASTDQEIRVRGSAASHFVLSAADGGARRISIEADDLAHLQVSLVRLPDELAHLQLNTECLTDGSWRLRIRESAGQAVMLSHLVWEPAQASGDEAASPSQICLTDERFSAAFDDRYVPGGGELVSRPLSFDGVPKSRVSLRVAGTDDAGHRVAAWTEIDLRATAGHLAASSPSGRQRRNISAVRAADDVRLGN